MSQETRKTDHLNIAQLSTRNGNYSAFNDLNLIHRSLPETDLNEVELGCRIGKIKLQSPLMINAMTGGSLPTRKINEKLAVIARETGVCMAVGSQKSALFNPELIETYRIVREMNPLGIIVANLGANSSVSEAKQAVEMIRADMLQLHLNVPQELVMPEGDRAFKGTLEKIQLILEKIEVPVIIKEVGFGMGRETYQQLKSAGVSIVDVGGYGGANFIRIENERRELKEYSFLYDWGQTTVVSLLESLAFQDQMQFVASGGIRNCLDMMKCFVLGASAIGVASPVLRVLNEAGVEGAIAEFNNWQLQLRTMMTMVGARTIPELNNLPAVITGWTKDWCQVRGIDIINLGMRGIIGSHNL